MAGRWRCAVLAATLALVAGAAPALSERQVSRFVRLADRFDAQLPTPRMLEFTEEEKRARAACILGGIEARHGGDGVDAVMELMRVLAEGAQFDDPVIVEFNAAYGPAFDRLVARCTARAAGDA